jgi:hypothetical protein
MGFKAGKEKPPRPRVEQRLQEREITPSHLYIYEGFETYRREKKLS